jgi:hypothetical protein
MYPRAVDIRDVGVEASDVSIKSNADQQEIEHWPAVCILFRRAVNLRLLKYTW